MTPEFGYNFLGWSPKCKNRSFFGGWAWAERKDWPWGYLRLVVVPHHATRRLCVIPKKRLTVHTLHTLHTSRNLGWGGGGGWGAMTCTVMHTIALAHMLDATQLHLRTCWMLRNSLAHMLDATQFTCAHVRCYATALAHMLDATQLHLRTCWMLRNCTCAHVGCYAIALAHMFDATQLHLRTCRMLRNCTCAHVGCYAIGRQGRQILGRDKRQNARSHSGLSSDKKRKAAELYTGVVKKKQEQTSHMLTLTLACPKTWAQS